MSRSHQFNPCSDEEQSVIELETRRVSAENDILLIMENKKNILLEIEKLSGDLKSLKNEKEECEKKVGLIKIKIDEDNAKLNKITTVSKEKIADLQSIIISYQNDADKINAEIKRLNELKLEVSRQNKELSKTSSDLLDKIESYEDSVGALNGQIFGLKNEIVLLTNQRDSIKGDIASLVEDVKKLQDRNDDLNKSIVQKTNDVALFNEQLKTIVADKDALLSEISDLQKNIISKNKELKLISDECEEKLSSVKIADMQLSHKIEKFKIMVDKAKSEKILSDKIISEFSIK